MARPSIVELVQAPAEEHDLDWLRRALQWAVELEFATIPIYLTGMWSIKDQDGPVFNLVKSVMLEEMLHMGMACNMLKAIGGSPQIVAPVYDGSGLPGGVRPGLDVYLAGLSPDTLKMYMQIELPENELAEIETFATIGTFYDAISAAFTALAPPLSTDGQVQRTFSVPDPDNPEQPGTITEELTVLATLADVQTAIATIKEQGEGTAQSPDAEQFAGGELAHYYRFGEILHGHKLIQVGETWEFSGDPVPFPDCWPVARVPTGGYPGAELIGTFDKAYVAVIAALQGAWSGANSIGQAVRLMFGLVSSATALVEQPLPDGSGKHFGPDFVPANAATATPPIEPVTPPPVTGTVSFARDVLPLFRAVDVAHMKVPSNGAVLLDDFAYMSTPEHAGNVHDRLSDGSMPPDSPWPPDRIAVFKAWIDGGLQP